MKINLLLILVLYILGCSPSLDKAQITQNKVNIKPDYTDLTVPQNIAPLNFKITDYSDDYYIKIYGSNGGGEINIHDRVANIPLRKWKKLLTSNGGASIFFDIYTKNDGVWSRAQTIENRVSKDSIDPYMVYRMIGPSYTSWDKMGIYERSLEDFSLRTINETTRTNSDCMNCHTFQAGNGNRFMLHLRPNQKVENNFPGTMIIDNDVVYKINTKTEGSYASGVYPAWHPIKNIIAFSTNETTQSFHMNDSQKIEVIDSRSDLIMYDIESHRRSNIIVTDLLLETFPSWSADGLYLYYCAAKAPVVHDLTDPAFLNNNTLSYKEFKYNVMRMKYDMDSNVFGLPEMVLDARAIDKSASHPRLSPDGRFMMITLSDYGQFSIWHKSSDLYLLDLKTNNLRAMSEVNSDDVDSYHTWSSNGRWFTFATRRDDGSYGRAYFSYIDKDGNASKPFVLPQRDPDFYDGYYYSYNIPELIKSRVNITKKEMHRYSLRPASKIL